MKPDEEGFLYPEIDQSLCVDLILVNSPNGTALFDQCRQDLIEEERPKEEAINEQKRLSEPSQLPANRRRFWEDYWRFGFEYVIGKKNKGHEGKNG